MNNGVISPQPFWLKVRKEYVFDNFQPLLEYLKSQPYNAVRESADLRQTLDCMSEIVEDIDAVLRPMSYYGPVEEDILGHPAHTLIRLMAATVKMRLNDTDGAYKPMLTLITFLNRFYGHELPAEVNNRLWELTLNCVLGKSVFHLGFDWKDFFNEEDFHVQAFAYRLSATECRAAGQEGKILEHNGVMCLKPDSSLEMANLNKAQFLAEPGPRRVFSTSNDVSVLTRSKEDFDRDMDVDKLMGECKPLIHSMAQIKPSPVIPLKNYGPNDHFIVRVISRKGNKLEAETIDSRYNRISGTLLIGSLGPGQMRPSDDTLRKSIKEGDYVEVTVSRDDRYAFDSTASTEALYRDLACDYANCYVTGHYLTQMPAGDMFVTRNGVRVLVHKTKLDLLDEDEDEAYRAACYEGSPMALKFYDKEPDANAEQFHVYAQPAFDYEGPFADDDDNLDDPFTVSTADKNFAGICLYNWKQQANEILAATRNSTQFADLSLQAADTIARQLFDRALGDNTPAGRIRNITAAAMAAFIAGNGEAYAYMEHYLTVMGRLLDFCRNREVKPLELPDRLQGSDLLQNLHTVLTYLTEYRNPQVHGNLHTHKADRVSETSRPERIAKLVRASNDLIDIIGESDLNNIKTAMAQALDLESVCEPIISDRTFYGTESLTFEFKSSVVYPPKEFGSDVKPAANPKLQRWAILKAVLGFLNSRSGGELLLGVNDSGYASGLDDDMRQLAAMKMIPTADMDHYRLWIQNQIDRAFCEADAPTLPSDIVAFNVSYLPEINKEGKSILRIQVRPYAYGVVSFGNVLKRPEGYAETYVRRDGRTQPVTPELRKEIERYKLEASSSDSRAIINVSNAVKDHLVIRLEDYSSRSGRRDRLMEPYKIWKKRGLVYGYDLDSREARIFKINRAAAVEVTDQKWTSPRVGVDVEIDPFGMICDRSDSFDISLALTDYGRLLLLEESPEAELSIKRIASKDGFIWRFDTRISSPQGAARFCMGLPADVRILSGDRLKDYVHSTAEKLLKL